MKKKVDFVFITLVYRNFEDLYDFCNSLKRNVVSSYEVVVVDAFYDEKTSAKISECSKELECHYLCTKNEGYGHGNNCGIDYAQDMFAYKYIFICNPDTILKSKLSYNMLEENDMCIAPQIIARNGKKQNPYWVCENKLSEFLIYKGYKKNNTFLLYAGIGINKIIRELFNIYIKRSGKNKIAVYACHGSFFAMSEKFIEESKFRYDEQMFLFYEEAYLAKKIKDDGKKIYYYKNIIVDHKEDGSMDLANIEEYSHLKDSYILYYERYRK